MIRSLLITLSLASLLWAQAEEPVAEQVEPVAEVTDEQLAEEQIVEQANEERSENKDAPAPGEMIVVVGAGGTDEYRETFNDWTSNWKKAANASNFSYHVVGQNEDEQPDRQRLQSLLEERLPAADTPLWLVLIGHGTYDRTVGKFNLRGPDVSASELKEWLSECQRPLVLVHAFSCSGAFLNPLQGENRVVITATNSGAELNYSRFGGFLAESLTDAQADLDHDDQVSLLEAYLFASSQVARFYESDSRLATEHALLEDNHDGKGTPADFFVGIRSKGKSKTGEAPDGRLAHRYILVPSKNAPRLTAEQLAERDRLEAEIEELRDRKGSITEDSYYEQLEPLMLQMARLYEEAS